MRKISKLKQSTQKTYLYNINFRKRGQNMERRELSKKKFQEYESQRIRKSSPRVDRLPVKDQVENGTGFQAIVGVFCNFLVVPWQSQRTQRYMTLAIF